MEKQKRRPLAGLRSLERVVRLPAYRGASGPPERTDVGHRRGNDGRCRRKGTTDADDEPERQTG